MEDQFAYKTSRYFSAIHLPLTFDEDDITFKFDPSLFISNTGENVHQRVKVKFFQNPLGPRPIF